MQPQAAIVLLWHSANIVFVVLTMQYRFSVLYGKYWGCPERMAATRERSRLMVIPNFISGIHYSLVISMLD